MSTSRYLASLTAPSIINEDVLPMRTTIRIPKELTDKQILNNLLRRDSTHPIHYLKSVCDTAHASYRKLPNRVLEQAVHMEFAKMGDGERESTDFPSTRSAQLEFMRSRVEAEFKRQWHERMGWEFDIVYTPHAYRKLLLERYAEPAQN